MDIAFNITRKCNKGCDYCYLSLTGEDLPTKKIKEILESVDVNTVTLTGGEPLMHPGLAEILDFISERGHHIHLLTNGIELKGDELEAITKSNAELFATYNSSDVAIRDNLTNAYQLGTDVNIHHVLSYDTLLNLNGICDELSFAKSMLLLYPTKIGRSNVEMCGPEEWFPLLQQAISLTSQKGIKTYFEQAFVKKDSELAKNLPCPTGKDIFIDADGMSYPCCLLVDSIKGHNKTEPVKYTPKDCPFLKENPLPKESEYIRICPIVVTDKYDSSFRFPSHLGGNNA